MKVTFSHYKSKKRSTKFRILLPLLVLFMFACVNTALAADQIVTLLPASTSQIAGSSFSLTATYNVSDNDNTLTTIGVRFHYDSAILQFDGFSDIFPTNLFAQQGAQDDSSDFDNDISTDKFVLISWVDFSGNWPNVALPIDLVNLNFTEISNALLGDTPVNVTFSGNAANYDTVGNNSIITIICENDATRNCGSDIGECSPGLETCVEGAWNGVCEGGVLPTDETCDNIDNNCDGTTDEDLTQATSCGVGECGAVGIETCTAGSWGGDTCTAGTPSDETCDNLDNNCDGATDEDLTQAISCGVGECASSVIQTCSAGDWLGTCTPGEPSAETCDNLDNDCDGATDEELTQATTCGVGECAGNTGVETCTAGDWVNDTCEPFAGAVAETCDGFDNDCDGATDEDLTQATTCGVGGCAAAGIETCTDGVFSGDTCTPGEPSAEICDNIDNDCDEATDEDLTQATTCGLGICSGNTGEATCAAGAWVNDTCDPDAGAVAESCDNLDNDCDGAIDEDLTQATTCGVGECSGNTGIETCTAGVFGNDTCNPLAGVVAETCDNLDNDCDGATDEDLTQATACGEGECAAEGIETCSAGVWGDDTCEAGTPADEICDELDNNCDGATDEDQVDSDGDGICDAIDICFGDETTGDTDEDGVCDNLDACPGFDDAADQDGDGSPDACEMGPDHVDATYDGNEDGFPDMEQANVASLFANEGQSYVTLSTNADCSFQEVFNAEPDGSEGTEPAEVSFPFGLFSFTVDCTNANLDPAGQIIVTFRMPDGTNKRGAITVNTYEKEDDQGAWYDFRRVDGTGPGVDFLDDEIYMYFDDNNPFGDDDPADNIFRDPGGPAFDAALPDPPTSGTASGSGMDFSGCFINTVFSSF